MEEKTIEPTRTSKLRMAIFELFDKRRAYKKHLTVLDETNTKHPKPFNKIFQENLFLLSGIEYDLKEAIRTLKSL